MSLSSWAGILPPSFGSPFFQSKTQTHNSESAENLTADHFWLPSNPTLADISPSHPTGIFDSSPTLLESNLPVSSQVDSHFDYHIDSNILSQVLIVLLAVCSHNILLRLIETLSLYLSHFTQQRVIQMGNIQHSQSLFKLLLPQWR